jgi:hypothetical protein
MEGHRGRRGMLESLENRGVRKLVKTSSGVTDTGSGRVVASGGRSAKGGAPRRNRLKEEKERMTKRAAECNALFDRGL